MKHLLDKVDKAILIVRKATGEISFANPTSGKLLGIPYDSIPGRPLEELLPFACRGGGGEQGCFEMTRKDGTTVSVTMKAIPYDWKEQKYEFVALSDVTEQLELERQLVHTNESLKKWVVEAEERNGELSVLQDLTIRLQRCRNLEEVAEVASSLMAKILQKTSGDLVLADAGKNAARTVSSWGKIPADPAPLEVGKCAGLRTGNTTVIRSDDPDAPPCARHVATRFRASLCIPLKIDGEAVGVLHIHFDRTPPHSGDTWEDRSFEHERKLGESAASLLSLSIANMKLRESLLHQAIRDPLTGLFNRRYLEESIAREVARAARTKKPLGIIMTDIDHFKVFNDRFGHPAGDEVLRVVSRCLRDGVRGNDIVCRFGGEEFLIVLQDAGMEDSANRAEQVRKAVSSIPVEFEGKSLGHVTMSFGVSEYPLHGALPERFIREADMALYRAKKEGRNRVVAASGGVTPGGLPAGS